MKRGSGSLPMKSVLFYWGKGSEVRVHIIQIVGACNEKKEACYLNQIAEKLGLSHVAVKRHLDLLVEEGYVRETNPGGKPVYLELTSTGRKVEEEFKKK